MTGTFSEIITFLLTQSSTPDKLWDLDEHKEKKKRSLDSNSYFHLLCDKLRLKLGMSMARCKNHLIADYGQVMYLEEGVPLIYKTNAPPEFIYEQEEPHMLLVKSDVEKGREVYFYRIYRGSHTYNVQEMNLLIRGTVDECQAQGIETATPAEIAHMQELWERKYGRREGRDD